MNIQDWLPLGLTGLISLQSKGLSGVFSNSTIQKQRQHFSNKSPYSQSYGFSNSCVRMWELNHKEGWPLKNWCFWIVELEKTLESPLDSKEIKHINLQENQPWILIGRTDAEAETPALWSSDAIYSRLIGKVPNAGKDSGQKEKRASEDEMAGWHHQYNAHELRQTSGDGEGQRGLTCCSPWSCRVGYDWVTEQQHVHLNHFAVYQQLTEHCKSTILQFV